MYNKLFDVLYTTEISEEAKALIVEKLNIQIDENAEACSPYVEYINTLINSNITEACLSDILDATFGKLSEAEVEAITEEFIKSSVISYISEAGFKLYGDPRPIGLTGLRKEAAKQENKAVEPKKPSAMDKLKSAVGKVKAWASSLERQPNPVGLSKLQAEKDARIKKAVEMGTGPKAPEAPKAEVKQAAPKAAKQPRASKVAALKTVAHKSEPKASKPAAPKAPKLDKAVKAAEGEPKKVEKEPAKVKAPAKAKKATATVKPDSEQLKLDVEQPKAEEKKTKAGAKGKTTKKVEPKVETPTAEKKTSKKTSTKKTDVVAKSVAQAAKPKTPKKKATKKQAVKVTRKPRSTNEAIADMLCVLANTNISEAAVEEIVEMISNRKVAQKAIEKEEKGFADAANALNHEVEMSAKTGMPVNPEIVKKAEKQAERYEHFKSLADKKFGS